MAYLPELTRLTRLKRGPRGKDNPLLRYGGADQKERMEERRKRRERERKRKGGEEKRQGAEGGGERKRGKEREKERRRQMVFYKGQWRWAKRGKRKEEGEDPVIQTLACQGH